MWFRVVRFRPRSLVGLLPASLVALAVLTATAPAAQASSGPLNFATPQLVATGHNPGYSAAEQVDAVACASTSLCVAVGNGGQISETSDPAASTPTWSAPATIDPFGNQLNSIACPSTGLCVAVDLQGQAMTTTDPAAGASSWSAPAQVDPDARSLISVSCPSTSLCVAVGTSGEGFVTFNPGASSPTWTEQSGTDGGALMSVSCPSTTVCVAVDDHGNVTTIDPSAPSPTWSTPLEIDADGLTSVSCPSTSLCVGVDNSGNLFFNDTDLTASSDWDELASLDPTQLNAVSCSSTGPSTYVCAAVDALGGVLINSVDPTSAADWGSPSPTYPGGTLYTVACSGGAFCMTGSSGGGPEIRTTDDPTDATPTWNPAQLVLGYDAVGGISCVGESLCAVVDANGFVETTQDPGAASPSWSTPLSVDQNGGTRLDLVPVEQPLRGRRLRWRLLRHQQRRCRESGLGRAERDRLKRPSGIGLVPVKRPLRGGR